MDVISLIIILLGCAVLYLLLVSGRRFEAILGAFGKIEQTRHIYRERLDAKGNIGTESGTSAEYDRKLLEENRTEFNRQYSRYVVASQFIAIFPLLGILGTVLGLVTGDLADIDSLVAGLTDALWTTFWGLICSIGLKIFDAVWPGRLVNDIDARFATVDGAIERLSLENILKQADE